MKTKSFIISALLLGFMLCLTMVPDLTAIEKQEEKKPAEVVIIPQEVKAVLQEGMAARQARMDIPFTFSKHIYLPAQQNLHNIFLIKVKNADLGFAPAPAEPAAQVESENPPQETPAQLQARNHVFLQFNQLDGTFVKEVYVP